MIRPAGGIPWRSMSAIDSAAVTTALEPLMSVEEIADYLRISERSVYRLFDRGELASIKVGGRTRIEPAELRRFIADQRREPAVETEKDPS